MVHIYTMEYYSAIKRNEIESFVETSMDLETEWSHTEWSKSEREKQISYINACMQKNGTDEPGCRAEVETQM